LVGQVWEDKNANNRIEPDSTACSAGALRIRVTGSGATAVTDTIPCANPTGVTANDDYNRANWDGGLLARTDIVPVLGPTAAFPADTNQYRTNDNTITPAEGAAFNVRMLRESGSDGSRGVHNPFLAEALLRANITELQDRYPGLPALFAPIQQIMAGPLGAVTKRPAPQASIARSISSR
jgi:hypothetical protein